MTHARARNSTKARTPRSNEVGRFEGVTDVTRKVMQANKGRDTKPEMVVRRLVHGMGYRYRLYRKDLPGRPDLVFGSKKKVIFVHGCFWHAHEACSRASQPKTREVFWQGKFGKNRARDQRNLLALADMGWRALVVWECAIADASDLRVCVAQFLTDSDHDTRSGHVEFPAPKVSINIPQGHG